MKKIVFTKVVASGNDFIIIENCLPSSVCRIPSLVKKICDRKFGVGADGVLLLDESKKADVRMRIFNADGSEARMCGNGARCVAFYACSRLKTQNPRLKIETKAGIIEAEVKGENVKIKLTKPEDYRPDLIIKINNRKLRVNFINTGVPHAVIFVAGINKINAAEIGRAVRYHKGFAPKGANVNFVEVVDKDTIRLRTYERGVEGETLACGTGSVASAIIFSLQSPASAIRERINVITQGGETLKVCFMKEADRISDVWLEGRVRIVYGGEYYV